MTQAAWSVRDAGDRSRRAVAAALASGRVRAQQRLELASSTPLDRVEQFTALADALTWGTGTLAILDLAAAGLDQARTLPQLRSVARDIARAGYRIDTYLPLQVEAVQQIGKVRVEDPVAVMGLLDGYADLLGQAGDANAVEPATRAERLSDLSSRAEAAGQLWHDAAPSDGSQEVTMTRLATALSYYVASSYAVIGTASAASNQPFSSQVRTATAQNDETAAQLAAMGFDASYVLWGDEWGRTWAAAGRQDATAPRRQGTGVTYQWYATVQGRMLGAIAQ